MKSKILTSKSRRKQITSADVGRYLKHLAALHRDPLTGNVAMSDALQEIASILIAAKAVPAAKAINEFMEQNKFDFEEELDFQSLSLEKVREILARTDLTKSDLISVGTERFGIAKSRMDRVSRDEIVKMISSAVQHEESLAIISEEAQRQTRTS
ncbi:hypothetical protein [Pseudogemmobacter sonorensis]|uniref:hypothetical protein n=1 Tax=Pseudogemmobacter sonorensis TaxID=2989681 RepID=UPI00369B4B58